MAENVDTAEPSATKVATDDVSEPKHQQEEQAKVVTAEAAATPAAAPNPHDQAGAGAAAAASSEAAVNTAKRWFSMGVANFASTAKKVAASAEKIATDVFDDTNDKRAKAGHPPWVVFQEDKAILTEQLKIEVLKLSEDHRTFTVPAPSDTAAWHFDKADAAPFCAAALEEDSRLNNVRFKLVPKHIKEEAFWSNYFYRISLLRDRFGVEPLPLVPPRVKVVDEAEQGGELDSNSDASPSSANSSTALLESTQRNLKSTGEAAARGVSSFFGSMRSSSSSWFGGGSQTAAAPVTEATEKSPPSQSSQGVARNLASGTNLSAIDESLEDPSVTHNVEDDLAEFVSDDINVNNVDPAERERLRQELEAGSSANEDAGEIDLDDLEKFVADVEIDDAS